MESVILPGNGKAGSLLLDMAIAEVGPKFIVAAPLLIAHHQIF